VTSKQMGLTVLAIAISGLLVSCRSASSGTESSEKEPQAEVSVKLGKVTRATLHAYVTGFGTVEAQPATTSQPAASAKIGAPVAGILAQAKAVEGERVAKGAVLFQLDSRVADVQVERARQAVEFAQVAFDRQKQLLADDGTSKKLYQESEQQLQAARYELANATAQRALLTIQAPIAGTVIHVAKKPGDAVDPATSLAEIVDLERLVVTAHIRTSDVGALRGGQRADISPGRSEAAEQSANLPAVATATIAFIGADVDPANDTVTVRASLPARSQLRPGQFVTLRVGVGEHKDRLAVPEDSVITNVGSSEASIAVVKNNVADKVPVKVGIKDNGLVEIEGAGVSEGMVIVTTGAYSLPDHTHVHPIGQ
jgi:membrane fusion protein (multidrug efflux system)